MKMKKTIAWIMCIVMMLCVLPISVFAEGEIPADTVAITEAVDTLPTTEEIATESVISGDTEVQMTSAEKVVEYIKTYFEEISVILTLIMTAFYQARKHKLLNRSVGTLNNNAIDVARNSDESIKKALSDMREMADAVAEYRNDFINMLEEVRESAEEKRKVEEALDETLSFIKAAKLANVELGNEVAELLVLANIPNAKKEELYSRHLAAVGAITDAEATEVTAHDHGNAE